MAPYNEANDSFDDYDSNTEKPRLDRPKKLLPLCRQMFVSCGGIILTLSSGMTNGYSAIVIPQLNSTLPTGISDDTASWIAGIATLAMPFGGIFGGLLMECYGRRRAQMWCSLVCLLGWLTIGLSRNMTGMYVGRFLTGLCVGAISSVCNVYIAEICEPRYRGFILTNVTVAVAAGVLLVHVLGAYLNWRLISYLSISFPILSLIITWLSPESPIWLIRWGLRKKAESSFYWLRADKRDTENELEILLQKHEGEEIHNQKRCGGTCFGYVEAIGSFLFWKPFFVVCVLFVTQQFSGINAIVFYTVNILQKASPDLNNYASTMIIDVCRLVMSILACWIVKRYNRRTVFFISALGSICSLFSAAVSLTFAKSVFFSWLSDFSITAYVIFSTIGLFPLPWAITGEIYPVAVRDFGNGVSNCFAFLMIFAVVKTTPYFISFFGLSGMFSLYGLITSVGTVILYFCLPETNNRSLQEVEDYVAERS